MFSVLYITFCIYIYDCGPKCADSNESDAGVPTSNNLINEPLPFVTCAISGVAAPFT